MLVLTRLRQAGAGLAATAGAGLVAALLAPVLVAAPAAAAGAAALPPTVSADALPTVQVNGVVWAQVTVGSTVYATGSFSSVRPAGAAAGTSETPRSNILAYDLTTGGLITTWAPSLNAQGLAITASPDGSRIYVAGEFTTVSGTSHSRLVALDATTGAVVPSFKAAPNSRVRALAAVGDTVYAGGAFTAANGQARTRLAAFTAVDGSLLPWAPSADMEPYAMTAPAGTHEVVVGGRFSTLDGEQHRGMGALDLTSGATLPWAASDVIQNYGPDSAIYSLTNDGTSVYGTAYDYYGPSDFENAFAANPAGGAIRWVNGCYGDTYSSMPLGGVLYTAGHAHNCSAIGGHPQTDPATFQRAQAFDASGGNTNVGGPFDGRPAATILHWLPTLTMGSYTGQDQAAWSVTGNSSYVALGGEFPKVNGIAQQGLVRFAVRSLAPDKEGPQGYPELAPKLVSLQPSTVRVSVQSSWDRDDATLRYDLVRGTGTNVTTVATSSADSAWWDRPTLALVDPHAPGGTTQTYRVRVTDPSGNVLDGPSGTIAVPAGTAPADAYRDAVLADGAQDYWRLDEPSGAAAFDWVGSNDLTLDASAQHAQVGVLPSGDTATGFSGSATVPAAARNRQTGPDTFSAEAWIKTATTSGGKIIGFGNSVTGVSSNYDRQVYMLDDGRLSFGVYSGGARTVTGSKAYNDGRWHHVVATLSSTGMVLYVDGARVGRDASVTSGQAFTGYWRVGGDSLGGWPDQPSSSSFAGTIDEVAIYPTALSQTAVQSHLQAGGQTSAVPTRPTDPYGAAVWDSRPDSFWRLEETSGTTAADATTNGADATLLGGPTLGSAGIQSGRGITLDGNDDTIVSSTPVSNPSQYSLEMWFKTTTTRGGKLIGFGNATSGRSSSYDRHVWMTDDGTLTFGTYTGQLNTATSAKAYNDGGWHQLVATQGAGGMVLYVDGAAVATNAQTGAQDYTGYWRVGGDNTWGGASSDWFAGSVDEVATYSSVLDAATVTDHFTKGGGQLGDLEPKAAFTSTVSDLTASFDGSSSSDPDGAVASYAWDFGDGTTGTGVRPTHTYASAGTSHVMLTVTDDKGATGAVTHDVTVTAPVATNQAPTAAFTSAVKDLSASFDASGSADADGSVASCAWDFGDGAKGTGMTASHTYAAASTYQVTLTVTDDKGATGTVTHQVAATAATTPPAAGPSAIDGFSRTITGGWGSADTGGAWTVATGATSSFAVDGQIGQVGRVTIPRAGANVVVVLPGVSTTSVDLTHTVSVDKTATGGGTYLYTIARRTAAGDYRARLRLLSDGRVALALTRWTPTGETVLGGGEVVVSGLSGTSGAVFHVRVQATGSSPTALRARVWAGGSAEPSAWQREVTDATTGFQAAGSIGIAAYVSSSSTSIPTSLRVDDLTAIEP